MAHGGESGGALLGLEILLLDLGLLLTLYTGWRISQQATPAGRPAVPTLAPFALLASALWILGLWILVQPMEMRGTMQHG
jgi:formate-dependent nitrite reductase membrane component NrfD